MYVYYVESQELWENKLRIIYTRVYICIFCYANWTLSYSSAVHNCVQQSYKSFAIIDF